MFSIGKLSVAYAVRHYAQRGSGTCSDSPGSSSRLAADCLAALSQVGTVGGLLGMKRLAHWEKELNTGGAGMAGC